MSELINYYMNYWLFNYDLNPIFSKYCFKLILIKVSLVKEILYCINHSCLNLQLPFFICIEVGVFMKSQLKFYYDTLLCHEDFSLFVILLGLMREDTSLKIINIYNYLLLFGFQFKSSHSRCSLLMLLRLL